MENNPQRQPGHETTDVPTRPIWITGAVLAVSCVLIAFIVTWMFDNLQRDTRNADSLAAENTAAPLVAESKPQFPGPRLQVAPEKDLAALRAREDEELNHYGWIDKKAGLVRIPIERAMELIVERGLPVNGQPGAPTPYRTTLDLQKARPLQSGTPGSNTTQ